MITGPCFWYFVIKCLTYSNYEYYSFYILGLFGCWLYLIFGFHEVHSNSNSIVLSKRVPLYPIRNECFLFDCLPCLRNLKVRNCFGFRFHSMFHSICWAYSNDLYICWPISNSYSIISNYVLSCWGCCSYLARQDGSFYYFLDIVTAILVCFLMVPLSKLLVLWRCLIALCYYCCFRQNVFLMLGFDFDWLMLKVWRCLRSLFGCLNLWNLIPILGVYLSNLFLFVISSIDLAVFNSEFHHVDSYISDFHRICLILWSWWQRLRGWDFQLLLPRSIYHYATLTFLMVWRN